MGTALGKQILTIQIPYDDGIDGACHVTIEGTDFDLVKYLQTMVYSIMRSYYYNGLPDEWKEVRKMRMDDIHISFKNKDSI